MKRLFLITAALALIPAAAHAQTHEALAQDIRARLSPEGQADFRRAQEEWQSFSQSYCAADNLHWRYDTPEACRESLAQQRAHELKKAIITPMEGLVIRPVSRFSSEIVDISDDPDDGRTKWPAEINISWPQIDNPATDAQRAWNTFMQSQMPHAEEIEGRYCDYSVTYATPYATPGFIPVEVSEWWYCHGAAHGFGGTRSINRLLSPARAVVADDLFKAGTGWEAALAEMTRESLQKQNKAHAESLPIKEDLVSAPERWGFTREGLQVRLGWLMGYASGEYTAVIPWEKLRPFMKKDSILIPE